MPNPNPEPAPRNWRPLLRVAAAVFLLALALSRVAAIYTESVNWDEFAMLKNAASTAASGELHGGGRPGLAVLLLLPLVEQCGDEIAATHVARLLWLGLTLAMLLGLAKLVFEMGGAAPRSQRRRDALFSLALLALVPAFLEWSIQVRSDQLALAAGLWAGVALLASRRQPALCLLAGLCFGVGYLASQKLIYVGALTGLLAAGQLWLDGEWKPRRELLRVFGTLLAMGAVIASFPTLVGWLLPGPEESAAAAGLGTSFSAGIGAFEFYRQTIGYSQYLGLLPTLLPHLLLGIGLAFATVRQRGEGGADLRRLALAWAVLALGLVVGLFHAAAFAYFWMTLGLFPAVAFAIARGPLLAALPADGRTRRALITAGVALLIVPGALHALSMLQDTQSNQRTSLSFIARNFEGGTEGFHPEGALFCRLASDPFPIYFSQHIYAYFGRDARISEASTDELIADFESRQVKFVLESFRLNQFPTRLRRFWSENYQPYRGSVHVAGRYFAPEEPGDSSFELLVDGEYRWMPLAEPRPLVIDGTPVPPGGRVRLRRGAHSAQNPAAGYLVLALNEPPGAADLAFYAAD
jgi:hypothetical protein